MSKLMMMGFQIILVLMFFTGIEVGANSSNSCFDMMNFYQDSDAFMQLQDAEQLKLYCTNTTGFFKCLNNLIREQTGFTVREMAYHLQGTKSGKFLNSLVKMEDHVEKKCRNETQLNTDFMTDIPCFERGDLEVVPIKHCMKDSALAYSIFTKLTPERQLSEKDAECITTAYQLGCIAATVREECGDEAFNRYKTVLGKTGFFRSGTCSSDLKQTLKTTFLESLDMTESRKNVYRAILDIKRRRK